MPRTKGAIAKDRTLKASSLRRALKPIYVKLKSAGVPTQHMPSADEIVALLPRWIDEARVNTWVSAVWYQAFAARNSAPTPKRRRRKKV